MKKETTINKVVQEEVKRDATKKLINESKKLDNKKPIRHLFNFQTNEEEEKEEEEIKKSLIWNKDNKIDLRETEKKFKKNPFVFDNEDSNITDLAFPTKKKNKLIGKTDVMPVDISTGQIIGGNYMYMQKEVDEEKFVKIYVNQMESIYGLKKTGIICLTFISHKLPPNKDMVYIFLPELKEFGGWKSDKQAYAGLKELVLNKIIAPSWMPGFWFINPHIVFNGNRITLIQDYVKKEKNEEIK